MIWHIRPYTGSSTPYGTGDGKSWENAWNGLGRLPGSGAPSPNPVRSGDEVLIHGRHENPYKNYGYANFLAPGITVSGIDCMIEDRWFVGVTTDNQSTIARCHDLTFRNLHAKSLEVRYESEWEPDPTKRAKRVRFENVKFGSINSKGIQLAEGNDGWRFDGCEINECRTGIYFANTRPSGETEPDGIRAAKDCVIRNCIFKDIGKGYAHGDRHAIGIQCASDVMIDSCHFFDSWGAAIECWIGNVGGQKDITIQNNVIRRTHRRESSNLVERGIAITGNVGGSGRRSGIAIKGNVVTDTIMDGIANNQVDRAEIMGNYVSDCGRDGYHCVARSETQPHLPRGNVFLRSGRQNVAITYGDDLDKTAEAPDNIIG